MKKIPMRTCVVTHEKLPKQELVRVVKTPEDKVIVDTTLKANGRGAYLKKDKDVFLKVKQTKVLDHHLETSVPDEIYEELNNLL